MNQTGRLTLRKFRYFREALINGNIDSIIIDRA